MGLLGFGVVSVGRMLGCWRDIRRKYSPVISIIMGIILSLALKIMCAMFGKLILDFSLFSIHNLSIFIENDFFYCKIDHSNQSFPDRRNYLIKPL
jgi:hypothetical protein